MQPTTHTIPAAASPGLSVAIDMPQAGTPTATSPNSQYWNGRQVQSCRVSPSHVLTGTALASAGGIATINTLIWQGVIVATTVIPNQAASVLGYVCVASIIAGSIYTNFFSEIHTLKVSNQTMRAASPMVEAQTAVIGVVANGISGEVVRYEKDILTDHAAQENAKATAEAELKRLEALNEGLGKNAAAASSVDANYQHLEMEMAALAKQAALAKKNEEKAKADIEQMEHDVAALQKPLAAHEEKDAQLIEKLKKTREALEGQCKQVLVHSQLALDAIAAQKQLMQACADEQV
jgi:hypothetical protein